MIEGKYYTNSFYWILGKFDFIWWISTCIYIKYMFNNNNFISRFFTLSCFRFYEFHFRLTDTHTHTHLTACFQKVCFYCFSVNQCSYCLLWVWTLVEKKSFTISKSALWMENSGQQQKKEFTSCKWRNDAFDLTTILW